MEETAERVAQAVRQRAAVYAHLYRTLGGRLGEREAAGLMAEAIFAYGKEKAGKSYPAEALAGDLRAAAAEFASPDPVQQALFGARVVSVGDGGARIAMSGCPLVDEWRAMGLPGAEVSALCRIARAVDHGAWEGALGFDLRFEGTRGEGKAECVLHVTKRTGGTG
jgi:hypothetical protein